MRQIIKETFAAQAYRTLLVAFADLPLREYEDLKASNNEFKHEKDREVLEASLTVVGVFALQDPLRPEIVASVR